MNRFLTLFFALSLGVWAMAESSPRPKRPEFNRKDFKPAYRQNAKKDAAPLSSSIEGIWHFKLGDYYFDDSSNEIVEYDLEATNYDGIVFFEEENTSILPMAAEFDAEAGTLTFIAARLGDFLEGTILVQQPSFYDAATRSFVNGTVTAKFDADAGTIEFPANAAMQWWVYADLNTPMFSIDAYTFEGPAAKIADNDYEWPHMANQIVVNKDSDNPVVLRLSDFNRIDFKDGKAVFNTEDGLSIPLAELATIHFEENEDLVSVESHVEQSVKLNYLKGWLYITGLPENSTLDIYSVNGAKVMGFKHYNGEQIDVNSLPAGIYVVTSGRHSFKVIK